jgi:predicted dehydrogenase
MHSRVLRGEPGLEVRYASRDPARAEAFKRRYRGARAYPSYDAAFDDATLDVVVVATPPREHLPLVLRALAAGKCVIVEKPAFLAAGDVATVRQAAAEARRSVFVAENYAYKPLLRVLREVLDSGVVGEPLFLQLNAVRLQRIPGWREDAAMGGGALLEGGIHWLHFLASLNLPIRAVRGARPGRRNGPDRSMLVVVEYGTGPIATLHYSWDVPSPLRGLRLSHLWATAGGVTFETNGAFVAVHGRRRRLLVPAPRDIAGYRAMWRDFLDALRSGRAPRMTLDLAERDLRLVEAVHATVA